MVQALMLRAAAGRAAAAGFWKTRRFCTASNAAIGRLWVWGVSHIALPSWSASPPHAPQTHGRVQTQLHQGAGCPCADLDRATLHTHAARPRRQGADPLPRCRARPRACERWRRERHRQTPGDHATNLGATMLVLLNWLRPPTSSEDPVRCDPESLGFSLYKMHSL
jgi:membrane-associated phospholipid phosphatase